MNLLAIEHLSVALGGRDVLRNVALTLAPGEVVALIGANGCGKTTLLRASLGYIPSTGNISWEAQPLRSLARRRLAVIAAYLPQSPTIEPGDIVIETLRLGRSPHQSAFGIEREEDEVIVQSVAVDLGLVELLNRPINSLSGGQRQRVLLGRCLAQQPKALVLDEPSTFLDMRHQVELHRLLRRLAGERKIGVLMSSHDLNLASAHSDRIILMKDGQILAQGNPDQVLTESLLSEAFDVPVRSAVVDGQRFFSP